MTGADVMTRAERNDLAGLVRKRERLMKAAATQRSAELMADFERQLGAIHSYDRDKTWKKAYAAADAAVAVAQLEVAERCRELGIPAEFSPTIQVGWYARGENASRERRAELRKMASTRVAALEKAAKTQIERISLEAQTELIAGGLTSQAAHTFLERLNTVDSLMPALDAAEFRTLLESGRG